MEAIILAGGFGSRLQPLISDIPKSMAPVNGKPFLEYLLSYLSGQGITRVVLAVGYKQDSIRDFFRNRYRGIQLFYASEEKPLGTGGGIRNALQQVEGELSFVLNGDSMFRIDLGSLARMHAEKNSEITIALRRMEDVSRYGTVETGGDHRITGFMEKGTATGPGMINAGIYLLRKDFFSHSSFPEVFSVEKDCFEKMYLTHRLFGFPANGYFLDIGIPEDYLRAQDEFKRYED